MDKIERGKQICKAALDFELNKFNGRDPRDIFEAGVKWAEAHSVSSWMKVTKENCAVNGLLYKIVKSGQDYICNFEDNECFCRAIKNDNGLFFMSVSGSCIPAYVFEYIMEKPALPKKPIIIDV